MSSKLFSALARASAVVAVSTAMLFAVPGVVMAQSGSDDIFVVPPTSDTQPGTSTGTTVITPTPSPTPTPGPGVDSSTNEVLDNICAGANFEIGSSCAANVASRDAEARFSNLIKSVVNIFSTVVGIVAVIMILIGGLRYITSGGDTSNVASAKNTILYVLVGLVVVAMSQIIVRFVIDRLQTAT